MAKEDVDAGRPVLLLTDLFYLDHYGKSATSPVTPWSWPATTPRRLAVRHRLRGASEHQARAPGRGAALQAPRLSPLGPDDRRRPVPTARLARPRGAEAAAPAAIARAAQGDARADLGEFQGLPALERLRPRSGHGPRPCRTPQWCARFLFQVIERRGTGGGNFRLMYSRFLEEAGREEAELAAEAARLWTSLAGAARRSARRTRPTPALERGHGRDRAGARGRAAPLGRARARGLGAGLEKRAKKPSALPSATRSQAQPRPPAAASA